MSTTSLEEEPRRRRASADVVAFPRPRAAGADRTAPAARTLLDIFTATVLRCSEKTAIDAPDAVLTYRELRDAAISLARRLRELGLGAGDRIGVRVPSGTAELYIAILGVLFAGAAYVPVDADEPLARADEIWERAGVKGVVEQGSSIATGEGRQLPAEEASRCQYTTHKRSRGATGLEALARCSDDAWVIFTSGSTGKPKGVAVSHRAAAAFVDAEAQLWAIGVEDRVLAGL
ncbi:MAG: AMP-binding protein, partial [Solirubrobacterales bacterium]|nr:AMP-binding protein [Solirubrobacterales bacterium]